MQEVYSLTAGAIDQDPKGGDRAGIDQSIALTLIIRDYPSISRKTGHS